MVTSVWTASSLVLDEGPGHSSRTAVTTPSRYRYRTSAARRLAAGKAGNADGTSGYGRARIF